jgi:predicted RNase H-like HicB family nuclease
MRGHLPDWRIEDPNAAARGFGITIRRPGGSHVYLTHPRVREAVSMPARRHAQAGLCPGIRAFRQPCEASMIPDVPYRFTIRPLAENERGGYLIEFPDLIGSMSDGTTIEDAITNALNAMCGWIDATRAEGHPIPGPTRPAA